jgi:hypothetical protein
MHTAYPERVYDEQQFNDIIYARPVHWSWTFISLSQLRTSKCVRVGRPLGLSTIRTWRTRAGECERERKTWKKKLGEQRKKRWSGFVSHLFSPHANSSISQSQRRRRWLPMPSSSSSRPLRPVPGLFHRHGFICVVSPCWKQAGATQPRRLDGQSDGDRRGPRLPYGPPNGRDASPLALVPKPQQIEGRSAAHHGGSLDWGTWFPFFSLYFLHFLHCHRWIDQVANHDCCTEYMWFISVP